jgi:hypothetical protein
MSTRIEATVSEVTSQKLNELASELGVSKSQIIDEALGLMVRAAAEAKEGHRFMIVDHQTKKPIREIVTPVLSQLEWATERVRIAVSAKEFKQIEKLMKEPKVPGAALRRAVSRKAR